MPWLSLVDAMAVLVSTGDRDGYTDVPVSGRVRDLFSGPFSRRSAFSSAEGAGNATEQDRGGWEETFTDDGEGICVHFRSERGGGQSRPTVMPPWF